KSNSSEKENEDDDVVFTSDEENIQSPLGSLTPFSPKPLDYQNILERERMGSISSPRPLDYQNISEPERITIELNEMKENMSTMKNSVSQIEKDIAEIKSLMESNLNGRKPQSYKFPLSTIDELYNFNLSITNSIQQQYVAYLSKFGEKNASHVCRNLLYEVTSFFYQFFD
ncbi:hypothetical protein SNEBB_001616, partial [Seison nebaliae]